MDFKQLLKQKKLTQQDLGAQLGLSQQIVSDWCIGRRSPKIKSLIKMSQLFQMSIDEIVECLQNIKGRR